MNPLRKLIHKIRFKLYSLIRYSHVQVPIHAIMIHDYQRKMGYEGSLRDFIWDCVMFYAEAHDLRITLNVPFRINASFEGKVPDSFLWKEPDRR